MSAFAPSRKRTVLSVFTSLLLVLAVLTDSCIGGRSAFTTKLRHSALGIGVQSAIKDHHFARLSQKSSPSATSRRSITNSSPCRSDQPAVDSLYSAIHGEDELVTLVKVKASNLIRNKTPKVKQTKTVRVRGGNVGGIIAARPLVFWENMVCGAISRSLAQTAMHPANTMKTILQSSRGVGAPTLRTLLAPKMFKTLTRGAGANFLLSIPHGSINFAVLELVRYRMNLVVQSVPVLAERADAMGPGLDFLSSAISTICCSVVSTPQMMITDNIMAGNFPDLRRAVHGLYTQRGVMGFYSGWWPGLVGKIPSYVSTGTRTGRSAIPSLCVHASLTSECFHCFLLCSGAYMDVLSTTQIGARRFL
jgi:hypothetical protein